MPNGGPAEARGVAWPLRGPWMLLVGYFIVLAVIAAAILPTLVGTLQAQDRQQSTFDVASAGASGLLVSALNQETGMRGYVLTGDPRFLEPYELGAAQSASAARSLQSVSLAAPFHSEVTSTLEALGSWQRLAAEAISDVKEHDLGAAQSVSTQAAGKSRFDQFRHEQTLLSNVVERDLRAGRQSLHTQVVRSIVVLVIAISVGVFIGFLMWLWWRLLGRRSAQRERELADRAVLLQSAIDASSDSLFAKDLEGRHILANRARAAALTGGDADGEIIGHTVDEFLEPGAASETHRNEELVMRSGHERQFQEILPFSDGPHIFSVTKSPLRTSEGEINGVVGIARDMTSELALLADRERLYQLEHHLAETLQRSMLGSDDIADSRLEVCARDIPAAELSVGGDWYDTLPIAGGRIALVVGDAVGHGIEAVTAMGQLRSAMAALVNLASDPAAVLEALDQFAATLPRARSSTCLVVYIDPGAEQIMYSSAGHMPPIVVHPGRHADILAEHQDPPLAVKRHMPRRNTVVPFPVNSVVLLYTDGLVERRNELVDVGLQRLIERVEGRVHPSMNELCDRVIKRLVSSDSQDDDVAMIAARLRSRWT
jgi:PAS domain S-box-containing protein